MLEPNESTIAILRVEIGPLPRKDVSVEIDLHFRNGRDAALRRPRTSQRDVPTLKWLDRLGLGDFGAAVPAGAALIIVPEIEHGLAEVLDDIAAIEIDVFDERAAFFAIKDDVLVFAGGTAAFHDDADRVRRTKRRVNHIGRNEEGFALADEMIDDLVAFADADFDVPFELVKVFFRIDLVEIVPGVWALDDHDEKVAAI